MTKPLHILHLEDSSTDAELVHRELRKTGALFTAKRVLTEADFLAGLRDPELDLVLADYALPSYDGLSALAATQQARPEVPFIFVSGTLGEETAIEALHHGATDYVVKNRLARLEPAVRRAMHEMELSRVQKETAVALRDSEKRFRAVWEHSVDGMRLTDADGTIVAVNDAFCRLVQMPREALERQPLAVSYCPADKHLDMLHHYQERFQAREIPPRQERHMMLRSGDVVDLDISNSFLEPRSGQFWLLSLFRDITERKRAEASLRESEERFRRLFNEATDGMALADPETGVLLDCNEAFLRLTGYERQELIGRPQAMLHPRESGGGVSRTFALHCGEQRGATLPAELLTKSGAVKNVEIKANVLEIGVRKIVQGFFRDVTAELRYAHERETTLKLLRLLNDHNHTHDLIRNLTGFLQEWTGCEAVGVRLKEGDDFPYFETRGFPPEFVRAESLLCQRDHGGQIVRDDSGNPVLECMCGNILCGRFDPSKPFFTPKGSFWTNGTTELLAGTTESDREARTRNRCNGEGYESVALFALRHGSQTLGLLQINDRARNRFTPEMVAFLEKMADQIAMALRERQTHAALRVSEQRFRDVTNAVGGRIWEVDAQGRFTYINERVEAMVGFRPEEMIGRTFFELMDAAERVRVEAAWSEVSRAKKPLRDFEVALKGKAGQVIWGSVTAVPVLSPAGELLGYRGVTLDITARKRAEAALRESEERYRQLVEICPDAIYLECEGKFVFANSAGLRLFGASRPEELLGTPVLERIHPDGRDSVIRFMARVQQERLGVATNEEQCLRLDGSTVPVEVTAAPFQFGDQAAAQVIVRDISARKQAEEQVQLLTNRLLLATSAAKLGIWDLDLTTNKLVWDDTMYRLYGVRPDQFSGGYEAWQAGVHPEDRARTERESQLALSGEKEFDTEFRVLWPDKSIHYIKARGLVQRDPSGRPIRILGTNWDITERKQAEEELRDTHEQLRQLLAHTPAVIYTLNIEGANPTPVFVSDSIQRLLGVSAAEAATHEWWLAAIHPEDRDRVAAVVADGIKGEGCKTEYRLRHKNGSYRWIEDNNRVVRNASGQPIEVVGVWTDFTERKQLQAEVALREQRLNAFFTGATVGMALVDTGLRYVQINGALAGMNSLPVAEHLGKTVREVVPSMAAVIEPILHQVLTTGEPVLNVELTDDTQKHLGRQRFWIESFFPVFGQEKGVEGVGAVVVEITEHRQAEAKIREQAALLDLVGEAIIVCDLSNRIQFWNRGAENLYGWSKAEAFGRDAYGLFYPPADKVFGQARAQTLACGSWTGELQQATKTGQSILVQSHWTLMVDAQQAPKSFLVVNSDITQKKKAEAELFRIQRLESIGRLASGIAHDLNNILSPIMMAVPILQDEVRSEAGQSMLATLETSAQRGANIVKQVLTFARGVSGERVDLQLHHLLKEMANIIRETFPKNITLQSQSATDLWPVTGDATQLHQVLLNLCVNAKDAMPTGGVLSVSAENTQLDETFVQGTPDAKAGPYVVVEVIDTGEGIPPDIMDHIFEPFFTTKTPEKGTGLGLSTVMGVVQSHGGFVRVNSKVGQGTQFKIYLPAHPSSVVATSDTARQSLPRGQGELILVVDDEINLQHTLKRALVRHGYTVVTANDGAEALVVYARARDQIKVVVTDIMMPFMDGMATIRALRAMNPQLKIIAASGLGAEATVNEVKALGVAMFLHKPFNNETFLKTLHEVLRA